MDIPIGFAWITPSEPDFVSRRITTGCHLGCAYLSAYLKQHGYESDFFIVKSESPDSFARRIARAGTRVVGLSVDDANFYAVRWLTESIKKIDPSILIILGGLTATFSDDLLLKNSSIDGCLRSYSESNFLELVEAFFNSGDYSRTPGLSRLSGGETIRNPYGRKGPGDLDLFPSPYLSGIIPNNLAVDVGISTSRGCAYKCTFCNPTSMHGHQVMYHSDERVIEELRYMDSCVAEGPRLLLFNEDAFALNLARTKRLCKKIAASPPRKLIFGCETRIEHLDEEVLRVMYAAGFRYLKFGLESGNPRVLNIIKKVRAEDGSRDGYAAEKEYLHKLQKVVGLAKKIGFHTVAGAVFGLPGERLEDSIDTLDMVCRLDVDEYYHNFLYIFPGTEIFNTKERWGYRLEVRDDFYPTIYRTYWPYPVELIPRIEGKIRHIQRQSRCFL
ncbi:MAG: B12-binding domain-containing radical SAM protein [Deltaproteobacteria bacterium]|nr:B12-binding domain-containing radical SAM protein [Deltaproteobacteria bacterium]